MFTFFHPEVLYCLKLMRKKLIREQIAMLCGRRSRYLSNSLIIVSEYIIIALRKTICHPALELEYKTA